MSGLPRWLLPLLLLAGALAQAPVTGPGLRDLERRAAIAEQQHRYAEAADAFLELVRAEPGRLDWTIAAGRCLTRARRFAEAVAALEAGHRRFPGAIEIRATLAFALLAQAENDDAALHPAVLLAEAVEHAEAVLADRPDHEDARLVLAQARWQLGDQDGAVREAEEAVRLHPQRAGAHVLLGRIAGDRFRALLADYTTRRPSGQEAADLVARIDAERRRAWQGYERAAALDPTRSHPHVALAQLAWLDKDAAAMREHAARALAIDPDAPLDHDLLGRGLTWQARAAFYAAIRERYAAAPGTRPAKAATLRFHEGRAHFDGAAWAAARACFSIALADNPEAVHAHWYQFLCAWHEGDHDLAERHAAAYASHSAPGFADVVRALAGDRRGEVGAIVRYLADRAFRDGRREASRDLNHVLACLADTADAWNNHAFLCRESGRYEDALASYQHALAREPDSPQLLNDTAVILHYHLPGAANKAKARELYQRAVAAADRQLADRTLPAAQRGSARQARSNALANLAALGP